MGVGWVGDHDMGTECHLESIKACEGKKKNPVTNYCKQSWLRPHLQELEQLAVITPWFSPVFRMASVDGLASCFV